MLEKGILERLAEPLESLLRSERSLALPLLPGSAEAALAWAIALALRRTVVLITDGPQSLEERHQDLVTCTPAEGRPAATPLPGAALLYYPAADTVAGTDAAPDAEQTGYRLQTLLALSDRDRPPGPPAVMATCVQALMQKTPTPARLRTETLHVDTGAELDLQETLETLARMAYRFDAEVVEKGIASVKGGLLDIWPPTEAWPLRIELFGSTVESIRAFDPETQRSRARLETATIPPFRESGDGSLTTAPTGCVLDYLPADSVFVWSDEESLAHHAALHEELLRECGVAKQGYSLEELRGQVHGRAHALELRLATETAQGTPAAMLDIRPVQGVFHLPREEIQPTLLEQVRHRLFDELRRRAASGQEVLVFFDSDGSSEHFEKEFRAGAGAAARPPPRVTLRRGGLSSGFLCDAAGIVVVAEADLYGRRKRLDRRYAPDADRPRAPRPAGMRVSELTDIEPGDLVVHVEHGIGRYQGLTEILFDGMRQEVLSIEYAEGARLHVPVSQAHLLSRYVGLSKRRVVLHRLGGRRWTREKDAAERAVLDLASSLLEVQAQRSLQDGVAFPPDTPWQHEFEASFPYRETKDQLRVIEAVRSDMESTKPMDRLVCGDAGYGKTEVAMRAAFKAVMSGKQVVVLVPTTVLAQQHFQTFTSRMAAYPVRIEMLSRFVTRGRQHRTLEDMAEGRVDIVIGTHGLLQPAVRFRDLGLVIVDEEQRFGVMHKEKLKHLRRLVDVLTLTATPIPRTLYMSMTGARDMSLLQTPPRERMAIETIVAKNDDRVVRDAILRELNRDGQVFYLYNRILTMEQARLRLAQVVPEARVRVAHGRMSSGELATVMREFAAGEFEVLLSTTIVESGVDIPRANTILIDRADRFGIADLYQLRGRVGRSNRKAYAYLLLPPHGLTDPDARDRIGAVKKYSGLSAGFNLALRDLEIRSAGNLLGAEQSGYITAVGFGLYCQLLQRTVARLKGAPLPPVIDVQFKLDCVDLSPGAAEPDRAAYVPYEYIEDERLRIAAYRRVAEVVTAGDLETLRQDWRDRYGPIPAPAARLLRIAEIRLACAQQGVTSVETRAGKVMLMRGADYINPGGRFPRLARQTADDQLGEILAIVRASPPPYRDVRSS